MSYEKKTLEQLNLLDRFLFAEAVEHPAVAQDMRVKRIHRHVEQIRSDEEVRVKYMQAWEERMLDIREAEERVNRLYQMLLSEGRIEEMKHAMEDSTYRGELMEKLGL